MFCITDVTPSLSSSAMRPPVLLIAAACLGMLLFGYDTGVVSGSIAAIVDGLGLTRRQA